MVAPLRTTAEPPDWMSTVPPFTVSCATLRSMIPTSPVASPSGVPTQ